MRQFISICYLMLASWCVLDSHAFAADKKEVTICRAQNHPTHLKASKNVLKLYTSLGYKVTLLDFPTKRSLIKTKQGICDGEIGRIKTPEMEENYLQTTYPIHRVKARAYYASDRKKIYKWSDLKHARVAGIRGELYAEHFLESYNANFVDEYGELVHLIETGRIDAIIGLDDAMDKINLSEHIEKSREPLFEQPLFHVLNKDKTELLDLLNAQMEKLRLAH